MDLMPKFLITSTELPTAMGPDRGHMLHEPSGLSSTFVAGPRKWKREARLKGQVTLQQVLPCGSILRKRGVDPEELDEDLVNVPEENKQKLFSIVGSVEAAVGQPRRDQ